MHVVRSQYKNPPFEKIYHCIFNVTNCSFQERSLSCSDMHLLPHHNETEFADNFLIVYIYICTRRGYRYSKGCSVTKVARLPVQRGQVTPFTLFSCTPEYSGCRLSVCLFDVFRDSDFSKVGPFIVHILFTRFATRAFPIYRDCPLIQYFQYDVINVMSNRLVQSSPHLNFGQLLEYALFGRDKSMKQDVRIHNCSSYNRIYEVSMTPKGVHRGTVFSIWMEYRGALVHKDWEHFHSWCTEVKMVHGYIFKWKEPLTRYSIILSTGYKRDAYKRDGRTVSQISTLCPLNSSYPFCRQKLIIKTTDIEYQWNYEKDCWIQNIPWFYFNAACIIFKFFSFYLCHLLTNNSESTGLHRITLQRTTGFKHNLFRISSLSPVLCKIKCTAFYFDSEFVFQPKTFLLPNICRENIFLKWL